MSLPNVSSISSVSIVTVTQYSRRNILPLLHECINKQTFLPDEWIIVEGSRTPEDAQKNAEQIEALRNASEHKIVYLPYQANSTLASLRNRGHLACTSDVIVCMDDDDYYPPSRIKHVIQQMNKYPDRLIAGCTNLLMYDYQHRTLYQFKGIHENHATQATMAFHKSYLTNHKHDELLEKAEESSFTNHFSEPMVQLCSFDTVIASSHTINTVDKKDMLVNNPYFQKLEDSELEKYFPMDMFKKYEKQFT